MVKNMLSRKENRLLENLIEEHREEIISNKWTRQSFAEFASRKLKRPVTDNNVKAGAAVVEVEFPSARSSSVGLSSYREIKYSMSVIARELCDICRELDRHVPPILKEIANCNGEEGEE